MPKKIQLSIPVPCHENWEAMTPVEKGKFCGSCQKQVIDFSTLSDRQVAEFFKKPSTGSVCGRFMTDQLDRDMEIPRKRIPWLKYFFTIALPAFFMSARASTEQKQGKIRLNTEVNQKPVKKTMGAPMAIKCEKPVTGDTIVIPVASDTPTVTPTLANLLEGRAGGIVIKRMEEMIELRGRVEDGIGNPVPFASIIVKGTQTGAASDEKGFFVLKTTKKEKDITLLVSCVGYELLIKIVTPSMMNQRVVIELVKAKQTLEGEVVVVAGMVATKKVKPAKTMPVIPDITPKPVLQQFKMYPNPLPSGSALTIECKQVDEGYYTLQLVNAGGQAVYQQELWIDAEARLLNIAVPALKAGSYFLVLTNQSSGKKFTEKIVIQ
jgi:hypothetical protein